MDEHPMQARSAENYQYLRRMLCGTIEENGGSAKLEYIKARMAIDRGMSSKSINQTIKAFIDAEIFKVYETGAGEKLITLFSTPVSPKEISTPQKDTGAVFIKNNKSREELFRFTEAFSSLEKSVGKVLPLKEVYKVAEEYGLSNEEAQKQISKLMRSGDLFSPKKDFISRI